MRVLYLSNSIIPSQNANTVHVKSMCEAFVQEGYDVTLVFRSNEKGSKANLYQGIKPLNVYLPRIWSILKMNSLIYALKAKRLIRKDSDYDIVYGRFTLLLFLLRKKHIFAYEAHIPPHNILYRWIERKILDSPNCLKLVVISNALKEKYLELFPHSHVEKITVLHDGAPIPKIEDTSIITKTSDSPIVGYLGHLYPGKCMEVLTNVAKLMPDIVFHVVGGTKYWVDYWDELLHSQNINNIKLYGYIENSKVSLYYSSFDIIVLPFSKNVLINNNKKSDIGKWFSPLKLFESMSFGKAIVVSNLPTINEVLEDGYDCLMCNPEDPKQWASTIKELILNKEKRLYLGLNAKNKFLEKYTWTRRVRIIASFFEIESK